MHKTLDKTLFLLIYLAVCTNVIANEKYTMKDLEVLSKNKQSVELFDHILDIRPSKRDNRWGEIIRENAANYIDMLSAKGFSLQTLEKVSKVSSLPPLRKSEAFESKLNKSMITLFGLCLKKHGRQYCIERAVKFLPENSIDHEYNYQLFTIFNKAKNKDESYESSLWLIAKKLTTDQYSEFYCKKTDFSTYLIKRSSKINIDEFHSDCKKELVPKLRNLILNTSTNNSQLELILKIKGLSSTDKALFGFLQTLSNSDIEKLNIEASLNNLSTLRDSSKLRLKVLAQIKSMSLIPDQVFSHRDNKQSVRVNALIRKIDRSFPEFIDYYTKKCINYLKGKGDYPHGSPTINCHDFFKLASALGVSNPSIIKEYKSITNI